MENTEVKEVVDGVMENVVVLKGEQPGKTEAQISLEEVTEGQEAKPVDPMEAKRAEKEEKKKKEKEKAYWMGMITRAETFGMIEQKVQPVIVSLQKDEDLLRQMFIYTRAAMQLLISKGVLTEEELASAAAPIIEQIYGKQPPAEAATTPQAPATPEAPTTISGDGIRECVAETIQPESPQVVPATEPYSD